MVLTAVWGIPDPATLMIEIYTEIERKKRRDGMTGDKGVSQKSNQDLKHIKGEEGMLIEISEWRRKDFVNSRSEEVIPF